MSPAAAAEAALQPVYVLIGDESYLRDRFREQLLARLPEGDPSFSLFEFDLAATPLGEVLDQARTPSLMAPLQFFFVRGVKELFGRGAAGSASGNSGSGEDGGGRAPSKKSGKSGSKAKHAGFPANLERFARESSRPPAAVLVLVADHLHLPADRQRMSLDDKSRLQRIETTLGSFTQLVYCARMSEPQAASEARRLAESMGAELAPDAARLLVQKLDSDLSLIRNETEKLALHALPKTHIPAADVQTLVAGVEAGTGFDLAEAIARASAGRDPAARRRCFASLARIWAEGGDAGAIGLVFQLSRAFTMALILRQERVRDRSALYRVLPQGLRPPGFAADQILAISRAASAERLAQALELLHAADVELRSSPPSMRLVFEKLVWALTS